MSEPQKLQKYICLTFGPYESIKELSTDVNKIINADHIDKYTPVGGLSIASTNKNTYKYNPVILYTAAQTMMLKTENPAAIAVRPEAIAVRPEAIAVITNESEKEFEAMKNGTTSTKKVEYDNVYDGSGGKRSRKHKRSQHKHKRSQHKHKRSHKTRKY